MSPSVTIQNTDNTRSILQQSQLKENIPKLVPNKSHPSQAPKCIATQPNNFQPPQQKKISRRSSKPIINWFQRKLAATVKPKRSVEGVSRGDEGGPRVVPTAGVRTANRVASSPLPLAGPTQKNGGKQQHKLENMTVARRKTISLNGDDGGDFLAHSRDGSSDGSSLALDSTWSPTSALEADEDASLRPIPPSAPPSPSPSRSSSSYLSNSRTFRSMAASTKPTTLLSVDLTPNGMAHIAQAPMIRISPHIRTSSTNTTPGIMGSGASVTFSALPPSPQSSRPSSLQNPASINSSNPSSQPTAPQVNGSISSVQAPLHTTHHPRNNPRPSSPPLDNASMLTLASSAFAMPGSRVGVVPGWSSSAPSAIGWDDSLSHFGGSIAGDGYPDAESTSQFVMGDDDRLEERDVDASVRALRPRSSRRGSWGSEASGWSARVSGLGTPSLARERSLWATNSVRTGGQFTADNETGEQSTDNGSEEPSPLEVHHTESSPRIVEIGERVPQLHSSSPTCEPEPTSQKFDIPKMTLAPPVLLEGTHSTDTVALITPSKELAQDHDPKRLQAEERVDDDHSLTPSDREIWHSAPSTPMISGRSD